MYNRDYDVVSHIVNDRGVNHSDQRVLLSER